MLGTHQESYNGRQPTFLWHGGKTIRNSSSNQTGECLLLMAIMLNLNSCYYEKREKQRF